MADDAWQRPGGDDLSGLSSEERALRELMHGAVAGIQPEPGGLPRIRQAVPRRRAARRGALTGVLALAAAVAIAVPVLHEGDRFGLSGGPGSAEARSAAPTSPSGTVTGSASGTGSAPPPSPSGTGGTAPPTTAAASPSPGADAAPTSGTTAPTGTPGTADGGIVPLCTRTDLGQGSAQVGTADAQGRIYGAFTVYNVSGRSCRLGGPGAVAVTSVSGTDRGRVRTADHTPGDPVGGSLPAMDAEPPVLAPQAGYRVPFAWIPDQGCTSGGTVTSPPTGANQVSLTTQAPSTTGVPASGATEAPSANPQPSSSPTAGPTTEPSPTATATTNPTGPAATATIAHTPAPGSPAAATASLPVGCGGTFYRGGVQPVGAAAPQTGAPTTG
ncbi:hypothetical protein [Kitasatospora sp. SUK 42]|uniref:hypothetical protein n=1 Tax=Kitasatospora sp. SUK 42 TaxID=1588882 RepID=UPI0018C9DB57|nr:hypothetical protein [Kitasatospora sp. SUK 42]MBV2154820.1 hypothetical protein [Kitasatospora sp. SUK 42]